MLKYQKNLQIKVSFVKKFRHIEENFFLKLEAEFKTVELKVLLQKDILLLKYKNIM